jgi:hypothetical protein
MAKTTGKNAVLSFGGTPYACLTTISINGTNSTASIECSTDGTGAAATNKAAGANNWTVSTTIVLDAADHAVPAAFDVGTTGAVVAAPEGDAATLLLYTWTTGTVSSHTVTSGASDFMTIDVTLECDGNPAITST